MKLLLASKSEARRRMLEAAGVPFELADSSADEERVKAELRGRGAGARALAEGLAEAKALGVEGEGLVLGADQTLELDDGTMFDKPSSREDALRQLRTLSGGRHRLHSAAVIVAEGKTLWRCTESVALSVRPLSDGFLSGYLDQEYEAIRWGVGGYRIEGPGVQLFDEIEGSHFAILGLPLLPLLHFFREREIIAS